MPRCRRAHHIALGVVVCMLAATSMIVRVRSAAGDAALAGKEWPTVMGDLGNTRFSTLSQINAQTIARLGGAWMAKFDDVGTGRAAPLVKDGLMFITTGAAIYAFDAKTGARVWRHQPGPPPNLVTPGLPLHLGIAVPGREGVAVGQGLVFVGLFDASVIAVREKTGEAVWRTDVGDNPPTPGQGASGAPVYANGLVIVGTSADGGHRGKVIALDAATGRKAWEWYAVPGPGEIGHETWPKDSDSWKTGGGAVWLVGATDLDLGLVYFGTGNGVPQYGGDHRAGDNLYLASVVALDIRTGKLKWHYQTIHHDVWEADLAQPMVLYDAAIGGQARKAIAAMRADGYLFLLDRATGKALMPIEERKTPQDKLGKTAPTQPFPVGADRVLLDCDDWKKESIPSGFIVGCFFTPASVDVPNLLTPSWGMRVVPMSFDPQTGYFYAVGTASLQWFRRTDNPYFFSLGMGGGRVPGLPPSRSFLAAVDSRTNKLVWRKEFRAGRPGSSLTTAGGLLFQMMSDGKFTAADAKTGDFVWQFQAASNTGGGPPATYEIGGEQHVAVAVRDGIWAFKLGGSVPPVAAAAPAAQAGAGTDRAIDGFTGPIQDLTNDPSRPVERFTNAIHIASLARDNPATGEHFTTDEYAFSVYRGRVKAGTSVRWLNNGLRVHTVTAEDGSWSTPPLHPIQVGVVKFDKPGTYNYKCKEHPWAKAQLIVVP